MNFLKKNQTKKLNHKDIVKKINYQLTKNFFTLKEIQALKNREVIKIIKIISKIEKIKLARKEIKDIALFLKSGLHQTTTSVSKLWSFVNNIKEKMTVITRFDLVLESLVFIFSFRTNKFELMLN